MSNRIHFQNSHPMNVLCGAVVEKAEAPEAKARSEREIFIVKLLQLSDAFLSFMSCYNASNHGALVGFLRIILLTPTQRTYL
jgi:hypothetical protein